jgi:hypothetical protein
LGGDAILYNSNDGVLFESLNSASIKTILTERAHLLEAISGTVTCIIMLTSGCTHLGLFVAILEFTNHNYKRAH